MIFSEPIKIESARVTAQMTHEPPPQVDVWVQDLRAKARQLDTMQSHIVVAPVSVDVLNRIRARMEAAQHSLLMAALAVESIKDEL